MLDAIRKLLVLQDRDRKLLRIRDQLAHVAPERASLGSHLKSAQSGQDDAKLRVKLIETERKKLELEAASLKTKIEKYSIQQFETKKNEEFKALGKEIDNAKAAIFKLEDQQLEFMEQAEAAAKAVQRANEVLQENKKRVESQLVGLDGREANLKKELAELQSNRSDLASGIDESIYAKYERLLKHKGENVVVGIQHGVCGGCHMRFPPQVVLSCKADQEIVHCPNCGRILFYTSDMDLAIVD